MTVITVGDLIARGHDLCDDVHLNGSAYPILVRSADGPTVLLGPIGEEWDVGPIRLQPGADQPDFAADFEAF